MDTTTLPQDQIYVWSQYAEDRAKEIGLEPRIHGTPAYCGKELLGRYGKRHWVDRGFIEAKEVTV